ncbi:MAG: hypothetical protein QXD23_03400 [Candidatus Micrarchaeaceae archaeon]
MFSVAFSKINTNCKETIIIFNQTKPTKIVNVQQTTLYDILREQPLHLLSQKLCTFDPSLCKTSKYLSNDFWIKRYFVRMFTAVLLHESAGFKYNYNYTDSHIIGFAQINTQIWNLKKINQFGYDVKTVEQLKSPKMNIKIGEMIFWHNLVVAFNMHSSARPILDYASSYYSLNLPDWYTQKLEPIFYNEDKIQNALNKTFK